MRILFSADPEVPVPPKTYGGVQRLVDGLIREFSGKGFTIGLVARADSTSNSDTFYPFPGNNSQAYRDTCLNTWTLWKAVKDFKPDVVHSFSRLLYLLPILPSRVPKIMTYGRYPGARQVKRAAQLAGSSLIFTGCSDYISELGSEGGGVWRTVYNFIDLERYHFQETVPEDAPLVFLSRIEKIKGLHNAIALAKRTNTRLIIAGNRPDLVDARRYWDQEIAPSIDDNLITYMGPVDDRAKNKLLGQARALVVPIEWDEPFGMVFTEALACGTPVITSGRGGVPEIIRNGVEGFIVENIEQGVQAVQKLSTVSRSACRERVEELFTRQIIASEYLHIYQELQEHS